MATHTVIKCRGQHSADNEMGGVPEGALLEAKNVVSAFLHSIQSRRGQKFLGQELGAPTPATFGDDTQRGNEGFFYGDTLVQHYSTNLLTRWTGSAFTDYSGTYEPPDPDLLRMKFLEMAQNLYFLTSTGAFLLDAVAGTPRASGVPRALDIDAVNSSLDASPGSEWMPPNTQVAYRGVFGTLDANKNLKLGPPSGRKTFVNPADVVAPIGSMSRTGTVVTVTADNHFPAALVVAMSPGEADFPAGDHTVGSPTATEFLFTEAGSATTNTVEQTFTSGDRRIYLWIPLPPGLTTSHFYRQYRSVLSEGDTIPPDDEMYLVKEVAITQDDIDNGYIEITDITPEEMLSDPLYTNPNTGGGIAIAKEAPPLAKDVCQWLDRAWYINTTEKHRFHLEILGVGSPDGIQVNDTITIAGVTYTAKNVASDYTEFSAPSNLTPFENVRNAAQSLVTTINGDSRNTLVTAYYESADDDAPGKVLIESRTLGADEFSVYCSRMESWFPALTESSSGAQVSTNSRKKNGLYWSETGEPEAVPLLNNREVGSASWELLRGIPLDDKLFLFPNQDGIYTVSPSVPLDIRRLDGSAVLLAADTAVVHSNRIFALTDQGVVAISGSGVTIVSKAIEDELLELFGSCMDAIRKYAFAVSYESDRQYQLWLPTDPDDTFCSKCFVYNSLLDTWMPWEETRTWGRVHPTEKKLYLGDGSSNRTRIERKDYDRTDYADEEIPVTITDSDGTTITLSSTAGLAAGDLLWQSDAVKSLIVDVDDDASQVEVATTESWDEDAAEVLKAISCRVKYAVASPCGSSIRAQFRDLTLHFRTFFCRLFTCLFQTEIVRTEGSRDITEPGFGMVPFGSFPMGQDVGRRNRRVDVPRDHQQATGIRVGFEIEEAWALWSLEGYSLEYERVSERNGK